MLRKASHVGMLLSFIIFITTLMFLYLIVKSSDFTTQDKTAIVEYIEMAIKNNVSSKIEVYTISIDRTDEDLEIQSCLVLENLLDYLDDATKENLKVINKTDSEITGYFNETSLVVSNLGNFSKIRTCEDFPEITSKEKEGCLSLENITNYTIGFSSEEKHISETKILQLIEIYTADYEQLKKDFNIPLKYEFGFGFVNNTDYENSTKKITTKTNIYVVRFPIRYISTEGKILTGSLIIRVW